MATVPARVCSVLAHGVLKAACATVKIAAALFYRLIMEDLDTFEETLAMLTSRMAANVREGNTLMRDVASILVECVPEIRQQATHMIPEHGSWCVHLTKPHIRM